MNEKPEVAAVATTEAPKLTREDQLKILFAPITNYSRAKRVAKALLGVGARVWTSPGAVAIGIELPGVEDHVMGGGATYADAFFNACPDLTPDDVTSVAGPELRAVHSLDTRIAIAKKQTVQYTGPFPAVSA